MAVWLLVAWVSAPGAQVWERYLNGGHGPYRGRVVDAETGAPLAGAVVVATWLREEVRLGLHLTTVRHAVRETVTDANGEFVLSAEDIEKNAPPKTRRPYFVIFSPGYGASPSPAFAARGFIRGAFEGAGATIGLPPLKTREERLANLRRIDPFGLSANPFKEIPHLMDLMNREAVSLGLQPCLPQKE